METETPLTTSNIETKNIEAKAAALARSRLHGHSRVLVSILPVLIPLAILLGTGFIGLDFGFHWDEKLLLRKVRESVDSGILLPKDFYNYPSLSYWLTFAGSGLGIGSALKEVRDLANITTILGGDSLGIRSQFSATIESDANYLRVRGLFLVVSSLTVLWVYLLQLTWRRNWIEALLAASILALSWEVAYHLRWIAPDAVLMQFAALTILLVMLTRLRPQHKRTWLRLAAIAAGLACGTKYQAGLLLIPVLIVAFQSSERTSVNRKLVPLILEILLIFVFSYLVTTPGTILAPLEFARDVFFEARHYQTGHIGNTVSGGIEHLGLNLTFFTLSLFSRYELIAAIFFLYVLVGIYALTIESRSLALLFLSFPVLYVIFISMQKVMILRNLLVIVPFFAILSARGIVLVWERLRIKYIKISLAVIVTTFLVINAIWLFHAAETIYNRSSERFAREAAVYIDNHPESRFFVSDKVWSDLENLGENNFSNITRDPLDGADKALFFTSEGMTPAEWPATRRNLTITWFGPLEVNTDYYPNWQGYDRIMLMYMEQAQEIGVRAVQ